MEHSIFSFIWKYSRRDQLVLLVLTLITFPILYITLELPKRIINDAIGAETDVIDVYQLHWPERTTNFFGRLGYKHRDGEDGIAISETVAGLKALVDAGKIRHWGLSNETPWGTMRFIHEAEKIGLAPPVSIQNPYSLLNRSFEVGLAEVAHREQVGLLAYSPLAFGMLSGKYRNDQWPEGARLTLFKQFARYTNPCLLYTSDAADE